MEQNGRHYVISGRCLACGVHGVFNTLGVHPVRRHGTQLMTRIRRGQEGSCGNSEHSPRTHPLLAVSGAEHQGSGDVTLTAEDLPRGDRENGRWGHATQVGVKRSLSASTLASTPTATAPRIPQLVTPTSTHFSTGWTFMQKSDEEADAHQDPRAPRACRALGKLPSASNWLSPKRCDV